MRRGCATRGWRVGLRDRAKRSWVREVWAWLEWWRWEGEDLSGSGVESDGRRRLRCGARAVQRESGHALDRGRVGSKGDNQSAKK